MSFFMNISSSSSFLQGSVAQWLARRTRNPAIAGSIPTTGHVVNALGKQYTRLQNGYPAIDY